MNRQMRGNEARARKAAWNTEPWTAEIVDSKGFKNVPAPIPRVVEVQQQMWYPPRVPKSACQRIRDTTKDYCDHTTLHGLRYTTSTNTEHWLERLLWVGVVGMALAVTVVLCVRTWNRFQNAPTLTTVDNTNHPIWEIPFPAVTLCNVNQVYKSAAKDLQSQLAKIGDVNKSDARMFLRDLPSLIRPNRIRMTRDKMESIQVPLENTGFNTEDLMKYLAHPCSTSVVNCLWMDRQIECGEVFTPTKSLEGNCCSFSYPVNASSVRYPLGAGEGSGLVVFVNIEQEQYFAATKPFYGMRVLIHDPFEYPDSATGTFVQPGESVTVSVSVTAIESDDSVRDLRPSQRACLFSDERGPHYDEKARLYNYRKCIQKCTLNAIVTLCKCAPFYFPDRPYGVRICNLMDVECMMQYRDQRALESQSQGHEDTFSDVDRCGCLPECSETFYTIDVVQSKRRRGAFYTAQFESFNFSTKVDNETQALLGALKVHFHDITCLKYRRSAVMTWDSLFATFGGIVGLCLGGSVLSLVELVYYATLRLWISGQDEEPIAVVPVVMEREMQVKTTAMDNGDDFLRASRSRIKFPNAPQNDHYTRKHVY